VKSVVLWSQKKEEKDHNSRYQEVQTIIKLEAGLTLYCSLGYSCIPWIQSSLLFIFL